MYNFKPQRCKTKPRLFQFISLFSVTWSPIEKGEIRLLLFLVLELESRQRLTVKRETKNWVNFGLSLKEEKKMWVKLSVLSNLTRKTYSSPNESPDRGRKKMEAKWLAGTLKRKWHLLPVSGKKKEIRKFVLDQTSSWPDGVKRMPRLREKKDGNILDKIDKEPYFQARLQKLNKCRQPENKEKKRRKKNALQRKVV